MKAEYLTSAAVFSCLSFLVCLYASKYELARQGISTGAAWWPPRQWAVAQIWGAIHEAPEPRGWLMFWGVMLTVYALLTVVMFPVVLYLIYQAFS